MRNELLKWDWEKLEDKFAEKFNMSRIHCYSSWVEQGFSNHEVAGSNLIWWIRLIFLFRKEYFMFIIYLFFTYVFLLYVYDLCELTYSHFAYHSNVFGILWF